MNKYRIPYILYDKFYKLQDKYLLKTYNFWIQHFLYKEYYIVSIDEIKEYMIH